MKLIIGQMPLEEYLIFAQGTYKSGVIRIYLANIKRFFVPFLWVINMIETILHELVHHLLTRIFSGTIVKVEQLSWFKLEVSAKMLANETFDTIANQLSPPVMLIKKMKRICPFCLFSGDDKNYKGLVFNSLLQLKSHLGEHRLSWSDYSSYFHDLQYLFIESEIIENLQGIRGG